MRKPTAIILALSVAAVVLGSVSFTVQNATAKEPKKNESQMLITFQREVIPIVEETIKKVYSDKPNLFSKQGEYYFDNTDKNNPKVVFLIYKENALELQSVLSTLKEKLANKITIKKAKYNPETLRNLVPKVADYVGSISSESSSNSISFSAPSEKIIIRGDFSDKQVADIKKRFGEVINVIQSKTKNIPLSNN
ncbi:hypothetical protein [Paenibacillus sp. YPG26]|uniref:hypothetical protein n=1 Tax=Paenibacillus sp. YPG26 TaxID=2878915 RepID=UPI00203CD233|nr:hypothetical protein [Paenibacillus sp. YPG26]USB34268.1 hypothetical protein LDO05_05660 [Paenibacillus sp. YPG26]